MHTVTSHTASPCRNLLVTLSPTYCEVIVENLRVLDKLFFEMFGLPGGVGSASPISVTLWEIETLNSTLAS